MRIRSTRPEFYRSERVASVSWEARYVLKALESYVDDNGVGKHDIELIVGDLFMRDLVREPSRTLARVSETISELHEAGLLWLYEDDGTNLLFIAFWEEIQRIDKPQPGRFRRPDGTLHYKESSIREPFANPREGSRTFAPVTGEQGNRGTEAKAELPRASARETDPPDRFDEFWETYSHKVGRKKAETAYRQALKKPGVTAELLIAAAAAYITWQIREGKHPTYTKHPATWLHGEHWRDERKDIAAPASNVQRHLQLAAQLAEREQGPPPPQPRQIGAPQ